MEFMQQIDDPKLQELFNTMQIDSGEAHALFYALDVEDVGEIHYDDFVYGCLKLSSGARAIDIFTLLKEVQNLSSTIHDMKAVLPCTRASVETFGGGLPSNADFTPPAIHVVQSEDFEDA